MKDYPSNTRAALFAFALCELNGAEWVEADWRKLWRAFTKVMPVYHRAFFGCGGAL